MPPLDQDTQSWLLKFFKGNRLFQVESNQITVEADKSIPLTAPWTTTMIFYVGHFGGRSGAAGGAHYYRDPLGRVHLRGVVQGGTVGSQIGVLPSGYLPIDGCTFPVYTDTGIGFISVDVNGVITHVSGGTATVRLDSISFRAF